MQRKLFSFQTSLSHIHIALDNHNLNVKAPIYNSRKIKRQAYRVTTCPKGTYEGRYGTLRHVLISPPAL